MITPKLAECKQCANILSLLDDINCKMTDEAKALYNNITLMLNKPVSPSTIIDLMMYKRILMYKMYDEDYAGHYTVNMIASKVKLLKYK